MKVTYIHHSSFLVELDQVSMIFDYYAGKMPAINEEKPLLVFVSHFHADHFDPIVFDLFKNRTDVFYILSEDIKKKRVPEGILDRVRFTGAKEHFTTEAGQAKVETFRSTDEGVAYWITCEGLEIYHAGDLNNWWWEGEDKAWNHNMAAAYSHEIDSMAGRHADLAFVPLDPRQEGKYYLGLDEFMKKVGAEKVFPMHFWEDYSIIGKMKNDTCSENYREKIMEIHEEGEEFII